MAGETGIKPKRETREEMLNIWKSGLDVGVCLGVGTSFALTRLLAKMLYGVSAHDRITFVGCAILLVSVALAASCVPARRAMRVDPVVALRHE